MIRNLTVNQARKLKVGAKIFLHNHISNERLCDVDSVIISKNEAKREWKKQYMKNLVWYVAVNTQKRKYYEFEQQRRSCFTMMNDNGKSFVFDAVYSYDTVDDLRRLKLLLGL